MAKKQYSGGSTSLADFKQLSLLGEGAYSAVYKVLRLADREVYALKKVKLPSLSDKEKQNALNEVRLLASIRHENIIGYKEAFFDDKTRCLCIVTECADSGDLFQQITKCQKERSHIPEADVWRYIHGMCHGLKALHDKSILHRDMKCANVFLSSAGADKVAKLGDFNVSKVAKRGLCMTQTGTPYYASPEVWRDMPYDAKSDMWSFGCVLYEMLALRPPFRAEDMEGLYRKVLRGQYPRIPPHYSHDLAEVIGVLLQVNPRHRPSVDQLLQMPVMRRHAQDSTPECRPSDLLSTIKLPKNALDLSTCLPRPQYEDEVIQPLPQESAADIAGGTQARYGMQSRTPSMLPPVVDEAMPGPDGYQDSLDAYLSPPQAESVTPQPQAAANAELHRHQPGVDSLDAYMQQKNRAPPPRQPSAGEDQDSLAAAAQLRESANPRGGRVPVRQEQQADYGAGRGPDAQQYSAARPAVPQYGADAQQYGGGRGAAQYNAYPGLPAPVQRYLGGDNGPSDDPRVRASPAPSSHAQRAQPALYGARDGYRHRAAERKPMASYARPQYALSSGAPVAQQAERRQPSGGGGLRLPRIFTKAG